MCSIGEPQFSILGDANRDEKADKRKFKHGKPSGKKKARLNRLDVVMMCERLSYGGARGRRGEQIHH
jgi:hypothetical protein